MSFSLCTQTTSPVFRCLFSFFIPCTSFFLPLYPSTSFLNSFVYCNYFFLYIKTTSHILLLFFLNYTSFCLPLYPNSLQHLPLIPFFSCNYFFLPFPVLKTATHTFLCLSFTPMSSFLYTQITFFKSFVSCNYSFLSLSHSYILPFLCLSFALLSSSLSLLKQPSTTFLVSRLSLVCVSFFLYYQTASHILPFFLYSPTTSHILPFFLPLSAPQ